MSKTLLKELEGEGKRRREDSEDDDKPQAKRSKADQPCRLVEPRALTDKREREDSEDDEPQPKRSKTDQALWCRLAELPPGVIHYILALVAPLSGKELSRAKTSFGLSDESKTTIFDISLLGPPLVAFKGLSEMVKGVLHGSRVFIPKSVMGANADLLSADPRRYSPSNTFIRESNPAALRYLIGAPPSHLMFNGPLTLAEALLVVRLVSASLVRRAKLERELADAEAAEAKAEGGVAKKELVLEIERLRRCLLTMPVTTVVGELDKDSAWLEPVMRGLGLYAIRVDEKVVKQGFGRSPLLPEAFSYAPTAIPSILGTGGRSLGDCVSIEALLTGDSGCAEALALPSHKNVRGLLAGCGKQEARLVLRGSEDADADVVGRWLIGEEETQLPASQNVVFYGPKGLPFPQLWHTAVTRQSPVAPFLQSLEITNLPHNLAPSLLVVALGSLPSIETLALGQGAPVGLLVTLWIFYGNMRSLKHVSLKNPAGFKETDYAAASLLGTPQRAYDAIRGLYTTGDARAHQDQLVCKLIGSEPQAASESQWWQYARALLVLAFTADIEAARECEKTRAKNANREKACHRIAMHARRALIDNPPGENERYPLADRAANPMTSHLKRLEIGAGCNSTHHARYPVLQLLSILPFGKVDTLALRFDKAEGSRLANNWQTAAQHAPPGTEGIAPKKLDGFASVEFSGDFTEGHPASGTPLVDALLKSLLQGGSVSKFEVKASNGASAKAFVNSLRRAGKGAPPADRVFYPKEVTLEGATDVKTLNGFLDRMERPGGVTGPIPNGAKPKRKDMVVTVSFYPPPKSDTAVPTINNQLDAVTARHFRRNFAKVTITKAHGLTQGVFDSSYRLGGLRNLQSLAILTPYDDETSATDKDIAHAGCIRVRSPEADDTTVGRRYTLTPAVLTAFLGEMSSLTDVTLGALRLEETQDTQAARDGLVEDFRRIVGPRVAAAGVSKELRVRFFVVHADDTTTWDCTYTLVRLSQ